MKTLKIVIWTILGAFSIWAVYTSITRDQKVEYAPAQTNQKSDGLQVQVNVVCQTTKGELDIVVMPDWSPLGAQRFLQLVDEGYYTNLPLFRCMAGFVCQFGAKPPTANINVYPAIQDDPQKPELRNFKTGYLSFAGFEPNSRSNHIFIALAPVDSLGSQPWETPIGYVTDESMQSTGSHFETSYGEVAPTGTGPDPDKIQAPDGVDYLKNNFPLLDSFLSCARKN